MYANGELKKEIKKEKSFTMTTKNQIFMYKPSLKV